MTTKGTNLYARAVVALAEKPRTVDELAAAIGGWRNPLATCVQVLHSRRLAYVSGWRKQLHGRMVPLWAFGDHDDAPCSVSHWPPSNPARVRSSAVAFTVLMRRLLDEPATREELAAESGLHVNSVERMLRVLRPVLHVETWDRELRQPRPCYRFGKRKDAPRPKAQDHALVQRRFRERRRAAAQFAPLVEAMNQPIFNLAQQCA